MILELLILFFLGFLFGVILTFIYFLFIYLPTKIKQSREDAISRSKASLSGQILEQFAPYLKGFPFLASEAKFIGKPIDFIVFEGLESGEVEKIIFVEVKSGRSYLTKTQKSIKKTVLDKKVEWFEYYIEK
ncbi:MAG: Holliday junction resolvase-like protein [Candidatus Anstonellaceae archaeon]